MYDTHRKLLRRACSNGSGFRVPPIHLHRLDTGQRVCGIVGLEVHLEPVHDGRRWRRFRPARGAARGGLDGARRRPRGLRDAYTLEAYLALVETARSHVYVVKTFPLQLEVQRALLRAVRRGVRVRVLCGNVLPLHGASPEPFGGAGASLRGLATQLVHARLDALVAAGADAYQFAVRGVPGVGSAAR